MGWYGGEWVNGPCEDAPCCGCCGAAAQAADDRYMLERDDFDQDYWEDEDEASEDEQDDDGSDYWQAEDAALESSLFGDC